MKTYRRRWRVICLVEKGRGGRKEGFTINRWNRNTTRAFRLAEALVKSGSNELFEGLTVNGIKGTSAKGIDVCVRDSGKSETEDKGKKVK